MSGQPFTIRLGTRSSVLAQWQTTYTQQLLHAAYPDLQSAVHLMTTHGDRVLDTPLPLVGGKGLFTAELEAALREHTIDLAVHSLKDLPTALSAGLVIGAIPARENAADVLVSRASYTLSTLPIGATVGTSSRRRAAQLLYQRPDVRLEDIRGNVDTRVRKALDPTGPYDAIVLAYAGLERLERRDVISQILPFDAMLPAPGQGALAVQCRDEQALLTFLSPLHDCHTALAVTAERAFLAALGGGCSVPIAAYGYVQESRLHLQGRITANDGSAQIDVRASVLLDQPADSMPAAQQLGATLAQTALGQGAASLLEEHP